MELESDPESLGHRDDEHWEFVAESEGSIELGGPSDHESHDCHGTPDGHEPQDDTQFVREDDDEGGFQLEEDGVHTGGFKLENDCPPLAELFPPGQPIPDECRALLRRVHAAVQMWSPKLLKAAAQEQLAGTHYSRACVQSLTLSIRVAASLLGLRPWRLFRFFACRK